MELVASVCKDVIFSAILDWLKGSRSFLYCSNSIFDKLPSGIFLYNQNIYFLICTRINVGPLLASIGDSLQSQNVVFATVIGMHSAYVTPCRIFNMIRRGRGG